MKLTLGDLNAGISWWLKKDNWPRDFHNSDYYQIYEMRKDGLTRDWWRTTVDRLWDWRAIRSKTTPNTKAEIERRGIQVLEQMNAMYSSLLASAKGEPLFLNLDWAQIADFYRLLAAIKGANSSVFPSKLGHFIFPKLFVVTDNEATHAQPYDVFWSSMRQAWNKFEEQQEATVILRSQICQHAREVHKDFPLEIKVIELCSIGRKHTSNQAMVAPNNGIDEMRTKPRRGGIMTPTQFKATVRRTTKKGDPLRLTVDVKKSEAYGLPYQEGLKCTFHLLIGNDSYDAFFRTTAQYVYITTPLTDDRNQEIPLTKILSLNGYRPNQPVLLNREQKGIRLSSA